jgi:hypothetical protein
MGNKKKVDETVKLRSCGNMNIDGEAWLSDDTLKVEMS